MALRRGFYPLQGPLDEPADRPGLLSGHTKFPMGATKYNPSSYLQPQLAKTLARPNSAPCTLSGSLVANRTWRSQYRMLKSPDMSAFPPQKSLMVLTGKVNYKQLLGEQKSLSTKAAESDVKYREMLDDFDRMKVRIRDHFSVLIAKAVARQQEQPEISLGYADGSQSADYASPGAGAGADS